MKRNSQSLDLTPLLKYFKPNLVNVKNRLRLERDPEQYPPVLPSEDQNYFRNDWAALAFRAFLGLPSHFKKKVNSFCTVGTGIGLDVLAAVEAFSPRKIYMTDLNARIAFLAKRNVLINLRKPTLLDHRKDGADIVPIGCNLFRDTAAFENTKFDLIYENLPVLPDCNLGKATEPYLSASFVSMDNYSGVPDLYLRNLLFSHYEFLSQARNYLTLGGAVLCNIGARVSKSVILQMFDQLDYDTRIIVYDVKRQTEAASNLPAYHKWSCEKGVDFSFYAYDILEEFSNLSGYDKLTGMAPFCGDGSVEKILGDRRLSLVDAFDRQQRRNMPVAHEVLTILGIPRKQV